MDGRGRSARRVDERRGTWFPPSRPDAACDVARTTSRCSRVGPASIIDTECTYGRIMQSRAGGAGRCRSQASAAIFHIG